MLAERARDKTTRAFLIYETRSSARSETRSSPRAETLERALMRVLERWNAGTRAGTREVGQNAFH